MRMVQQVAVSQCSGGIAEAEIVAFEPFHEGSLVPGRRQTGVKQYLFIAQLPEFGFMQQDGVLIQATENGFALRQQFAKRQETIALPACRLFLAPGEIGNISPEKLQGIRYHAAGHPP